MAIVGEFLTTGEVAQILGVSDIRVRQFHREERLVGQKLGMQLVFERRDVERFSKQDRPNGRPKKSAKRR